MSAARNLRELDVVSVQAMLDAVHPDARVRAVEILERARCGDGIASTADRIALGVAYERDRDDGLPSRMILKTLLLHPWLRFGVPAVLSLARASRLAESLPVVGRGARSFLFALVGLFQRHFPHAPDPMYVNEVRFYTGIRPELDLEAPSVFGGLFDRRNRHFGILMEDLTLRGARFPNATTDVGLDSIRDLIGFYLDELRRHGVARAPTPEEAWHGHRLAVIWGLVIGWLITPPVNYGPAITEANISRLVTAGEDLAAFDALAVPPPG